MCRTVRKRVLITGVSGLLGNNLAAYFGSGNSVTGVYHSHPVAIPGVKCIGIDLCDYVETRNVLCSLNPDVVIHCASRTDVDKMEEDREGGWMANVLTTRVLLDALRDCKSKLVHVSTDSVYAGELGPYREDMKAEPCNWYGATKLESERLVSARKGALILRTNLYGWNIQNKQSLAEWFLTRLHQSEETKGFSDARFSSIYTFSLAGIIDRCLKRDLQGTYNCACRDSRTKLEFGRNLAQVFGFDPELVVPTTVDEVGLKAPRGKDLSLDVSHLETDLGAALPTMGDSLSYFFTDWKKGLPQTIKQGTSASPQGLFYPVREEINYGGQAIDQADINAVVKVLKSPYLTQGQEVNRFEEEVAAYVGAAHGVAVNSGTAALHLACLACGLSPGEEGITSPITFLASANAIAYCSATPRFVDIDPRTYNISPAELENAITEKTRLIIPVHFAGQSCDMREIREIVSEKEKQFGHKIFIIEDASHALGSLYREHRVGCCEYSDAVVFSFHPVKHITTGEGGMVVTNNEDLAKRIRTLRSHGMTKDPADFVNRDLAFDRKDAQSGTESSTNPWYYEQTELGFNYRITDIQCALGLSQLQKLSWFRDRRRSIVTSYNKAFSAAQHLTIPYESPDCESNFHLYVLKIDFSALGISRREVVGKLESEGIHTQVHYIPVHIQPYYQRHFGTGPGDCPEAEKYYDQCLSLPLYPAIDDQDVEKLIRHVCYLAQRNCDYEVSVSPLIGKQ